MNEKIDLSIMFVDDEELVRSSTKRFFQRMFRDVYMANDGEEGLSVYNLNKPDIIVTDIGMPKLDGLEMSKAIRNIDANVPIIFMTAFSEAKTVSQIEELGGIYARKPIDLDCLVSIITQIADQIGGSTKIVF